MLPPGYSLPISRLSRDNFTLALVAAVAWVILYVRPVEEFLSLWVLPPPRKPYRVGVRISRWLE